MTIENNQLARIEAAITKAVSYLASNFVSYDAIDLAMDDFGRSHEANAMDIFDFMATMIYN